MTSKLARDGQALIPRDTAIETRVQEQPGSGRVILSSESQLPNAVSSPEGFWDGIELAQSDAANGRIRDACELSRELREQHGL